MENNNSFGVIKTKIENGNVKVSELMRLIKSGSCKVKDLDNAQEQRLITQAQHHFLVYVLAMEQETALEKSGNDGLTRLLMHDRLEPTLYDYILELNYDSERNERRQRKTANLSSVAVFFVDMDGLHSFNEKYDYAGGNAALVALADRSGNIFSKRKDSGFRYGGDEFVFLDPVEDENTNFDLFLQRINKEINTDLFAEFEYEGKKVKIPVTATISCFVVKPGDSRTPEQILNEAGARTLALKKLNGTERK